MAKNLKLNIKNSQLAEVLKLNKVKVSPTPTPVEKAPDPLTQFAEKQLGEIEKKHEVKQPEELFSPPPAPSPQPATSLPKKEESYPRREEPTKPAYSQRSFASPNRPMPPRRDYPPRPASAAPHRPFAPRTPPVIPPKVLPTAEPQKKAAFKEFRDVKPQKKQEGGHKFDSRARQGLHDGENEEWRRRRSAKYKEVKQEELVIRPKQLHVRIPITVKDLASDMKLKSSQLISKLFMQGVIVTLNDYLTDETTIQLLGHEFECEIIIDTREEERLRITDKTIKQEIDETPRENLILRPPVVAFMGHVDHGKTSLIDAIRTTNMAAGEAGAITQHIGAFQCHTAVGNLTILDTPGHEAFSAMRERGADVTDIIVIVIAGDEGIRPQTLEAIEQAQKANVPIVVAINKSDKPGFNVENVYRQLSENNLLPESWGGSVITVNCSAVTKEGIQALLEMLALQAEILELKANPQARARGSVIESQMHKGLGAVATILVQNGTLRLGNSLVTDKGWARVKTMHDEHGKELLEAPPSTPVKITGLSTLPDAGTEFIAVKTEKEARELGMSRNEGNKISALHQIKKVGLENLLQEKEKVERKALTLILRADVQGSLEALKTSLLKIHSDKVGINIISSSVGEISESDVQLAATSKAVILGFHTQLESRAEPLVRELRVKIKLHDIIYHAVDDIRATMQGLLDKLSKEIDTGTAEVKAVFKASQVGLIAGCQVTDGTIKRSNQVRLVRDGATIWKGAIASLKRVKEDVREVSKGYECGILLHNFNDVKVGDLMQAYEIVYYEQQL